MHVLSEMSIILPIVLPMTLKFPFKKIRDPFLSSKESFPNIFMKSSVKIDNTIFIN